MKAGSAVWPLVLLDEWCTKILSIPTRHCQGIRMNRMFQTETSNPPKRLGRHRELRTSFPRKG